MWYLVSSAVRLRKQRALNVVVWFAFSFLFILGLQNDSHRIVLTTFRANDLTSINIILKVPHRYTQRFFFYNFVLYIIFSFFEIAILSFFSLLFPH